MKTILLLAMTALPMMASGWSDWARLPAPIAGQSAGFSHDALIVAGGSSFAQPPWDGGVKKWHDEVTVFHQPSHQTATFHLPHPLAYGCSVVWHDRLIIAGGSDGNRHYREVRELEWTGSTIRHASRNPLPEPRANCAAALIDDTMYVFGGTADPSAAHASAAFYALDLAQPKAAWRSLPPLAAPGRILPVFCSVGRRLYLFSGAALTPDRVYLKDGWTFRRGGQWRRIANAPHPVVAASSVADSAHSLLIFSGDNGRLAPQIQQLKDTHPGFSTAVLQFDTLSSAWKEVASMPLSVVTTTACRHDGLVLIPGGEDRPGHRSDRVLAWRPVS